jgi:phage-related baseplate assembly protein
MCSLDLSSLPEPSFIDRDATAVTSEMVSQFETMTKRTLYPAQPERVEIDMVAYREMLLRIGIQSAAKQNLLAYATDENLDQLAAFYNVTRLPAASARTTLQFSVTTARPAAVAIPAGTQVQTKDGKYSFATSAAVTLAAGSLSVTATGVATTAGTGANGYLPGEIANLVDNVDVDAVVNTTTSYGGLAAEDDDRLRTRTQLATEAFSTCGPVGAYRFWALSAHQGIVDVAVVSPSAGVVQVHPLMSDGLPSSEVIALVATMLLDEKVRPLTDLVKVLPPTSHDYTIHVAVTVEDGYDAATVVAKAKTALEIYATGRAARLGRDIVPAQIISAAAVTGVHDVSVIAPGLLVLGDAEWAHCTGVSVDLTGVVDG